MNLSHLRYFKKLAEVEHFTRAAEELYIAQPTLSIAINRLEEELGAPLFERSHGKVQLTECGRQFYQFVSTGLANIDRGVQIVHEYADDMNSVINLGSLYAIQGKDWSQALYQFRQTCGLNPKINVKQGYSVDLIRDLARGDLDVVFASRTADTDTNQFNLLQCWSQQLVVCVNIVHPLAKLAKVRLDQLVDYRVLTYQPESPCYAAVMALVKGKGLTVDANYDDEITMSSLLESDPHNVGLFCYSYMVRAYDDLVFLPVVDVPLDFHKVYLISRREPHPRVLAEFIDFMSSHRFPSVVVQ
ncbi:MAG: LysR family transcriptional regulator [Eggerthellaceae bacterium]|jgi:DNA-binding transcriptional LysR family regulator